MKCIKFILIHLLSMFLVLIGLYILNTFNAMAEKETYKTFTLEELSS